MMREYQTNKLHLKFDYETIERDFDIYQIKQKAEGKTIDEIADWAEKNKLHVCHNVTVDDLNHLQRGGRISRTTAVLGTLVQIKPIIHMDEE